MANQAAWQAGVDIAMRRGEERRERKEALSDEEFQTHANRIAGEMASNRNLLAAINPQASPGAYAAKVNDLRQNLQDLRELYHPDRHPDAVARFGHLITDRLKITDPQARVKAEAGQRAANAAGDEREAQALAAATPQKPNEFTDYRTALKEAGFTPEQIEKALKVKAGIEAKPVASRFTTFDTGFQRYLNEKGIDPEDATAEDERDYRLLIHPHPPSMYQSQRNAFAQGIGKTPEQMNWKDEQTFLTQRYGANQPYAQKRLALAEEGEHLRAIDLQLRQSQNNMKDFLDLQKILSPMEKVQTTAARADELVANPSGTGDTALVLAFIDAAKPGTGFRFTEAERVWMTTGSRGVAEGAMTRINQGFTGETLSDEQRQHMAAIIKEAAAQAAQQRDSILGAAGQINPTAAGLAGGVAAPTAAATPAKPGHLKAKAKANVDAGVSDDDFLKSIK
jgi:hypothetical protein